MNVLDVVVALRLVCQLRPLDPSPFQDLPETVSAEHVVTNVDVRAWIAVCVGLLPVFSEGQQTLAAAHAEIKKILTVITVRRASGLILRAARQLGTSRRLLREVLEELGLQPWPRARRRPLPGTRVVAIARIEPAAIYVYGRGVYVGEERPPDGTVTRYWPVGDSWPATHTTARLELDDERGTVWGVQCTWMTEADYAERYYGMPVRFLPVPGRITGPSTG